MGDMWDAFTHNDAVITFWWIIIVILLGLIAGRVINLVQRLLIKSYSVISTHPQWHITIVQAVSWAIHVIVWFIVVATIGRNLGLPPALITALGTIFGAALGFGSQEVVRDVVKGLVHLLEKQFVVGEYVTLNVSGVDHSGTVEEVNLRNIVINTENQGRISVPQGAIGVVKNYHRSDGVFTVSLPFETYISIAKVTASIEEIIEKYNSGDMEALAQWLPEEDYEAVRKTNRVSIRGVTGVDKGAITIDLVGSAQPGMQFAAKRTLLKAVSTKLNHDGFRFKQNYIPEFGEG